MTGPPYVVRGAGSGLRHFGPTRYVRRIDAVLGTYGW
jgi:hypothetical protein